jgi:hypothetical protein
MFNERKYVEKLEGHIVEQCCFYLERTIGLVYDISILFNCTPVCNTIGW